MSPGEQGDPYDGTIPFIHVDTDYGGTMRATSDGRFMYFALSNFAYRVRSGVNDAPAGDPMGDAQVDRR